MCIRDRAADARWSRAVGIAQAAAQREAAAMRVLHQQGTDQAGILALAWAIADYPRFGIVERFELEQVVAASGVVMRIDAMPVSYTHLDVYKRQFQRRNGCSP